MPEKRRQNERLIAVLVVGVILLNYPLLSIFSKVKLFLGVPVIYLYLFLIWISFIGCVAIILEKTKSPSIITDSSNTKQTG
jgi:hypothetical protein